MFLDPLRAPAQQHALRNICIAFATCLPVLPVAAQTAAPGAAASAAELTPAERIKRDENVFRWITIHADKPRKVATPPAKEEKPPTVVRLKAPPAPAPAAVAPTTAAASTPAPVVASNTTSPKAEAAAPVPAATPPATVPAAVDADKPRASLGAPAAAIVNAPPVVPEEDDASDNLTLVTQVEPKFPISVVRTLRSGQVQVKFTVMPDGSVTDVSVVSTTNTRLNTSALAAVTQWRFAPVRKPQQGVVELGFNNAE